jgi:hypothetical protein
MAILVSNNASAEIALSLTASDTSIILAAGQGVEFPSPGASDYFYATLVDSSNNLEIVKCTSRSADTLTVVRGQDNTSARSFAAGSLLELRIVAATFTDLQNEIVPDPLVPVGTRMLFQQTSAPTGWTKITTNNDAALRVVSGTASSGGVTDFSTIFSITGPLSSATILSTAQIPNHSHSLSPNFNVNFSRAGFDPGGLAFLTSDAGGGPFSITATGSGAGHTHTTPMQVKYVDVIVASKDA